MTNESKNTVRRLNTRLKKLGYRLCKSRPGGEKSNLGDYHIIDIYANDVKASHVDINDLENNWDEYEYLK